MNNDETIPVCRKCSTKAVKAEAGLFNHIPYWYCRACKVEVDEYGHEITFGDSEKFLLELEEYMSKTFAELDLDDDSDDEDFSKWRSGW